jgi:hypothetical protein
MATVTGLTAARMLAIEAKTVTGGSIDEFGHLILTQTDGGTVDAGFFPPASETVKGVVELATSAETSGATDNTRAVTPASLVPTLGRITALESATVKVVSGKTESELPVAYGTGISMQSLSPGSGWTPNSGVGTVVTHKVSTNRCSQTFYSNSGGTKPVLMWTRSYHDTEGGGGWTPWMQMSVMNNLVPGSFTQTTLFTDYPQGQSRIYYTAVNSTAWTFSGRAGEITTYRDGTDFARQTWTQHAGGSANNTEMWVRTANAASGWSKWLIVAGDTGWVTIPYAAGFTGVGSGEILQCRAKDGIVYVRGGATGTFDGGAYEVVASPGAIPSLYRPLDNHRGGAMGTGMRPGGFEINPDGGIKLGSGGLSVQPTWIAFSTCYPQT